MYVDTMCLFEAYNTNACLTQFNFMYGTPSGTGSNGIVGLAPYDNYFGPSIVQGLKNQSKIDTEEVTLWMNRDPLPSNVTFGGVPDGAITGKTVEENAVVKMSWTMAV